MENEETQQAQIEEAQRQNTSVSAFLKQNIKKTENEKVNFERFSEPFEIKPLSAKELTEIRRKSTHMSFNKRMGQKTKTVDQEELTDNMIVASIVVPDLENADIQQSFGTISDPVGTIQAMLEAGEYAELAERIEQVSGFDSTIEDDIDEAKK